MTQSDQPLKVALIGAGTVGSQVAKILLEQSKEFALRVGRPLELAGVGVRDGSKARPGIPSELITTDTLQLVSRPDIDIVVELMGGVEPAKDFVLSAIHAGKSVVTGNKALLSQYGDEIFSAADDAQVDVYFEAAVAGAIPIVRPLRESLVGDSVKKVMGIVNGTTNYILDKMTTQGADYDTALKRAQELGYAEADPSADVTGADAAAKAAILASLAFRCPVSITDVYCEGITEVSRSEIAAARSVDCTVKLIARAEIVDGRIQVCVHPTMVANDHPLAGVSGANNAIFVEAEAAGQLMFMGPGAGGRPTASAVVGDLVTVARNRLSEYSTPLRAGYRSRPIADIGETRTRYFLLMDVHDRPGVLAEVGATFAKHGISVRSLQQSAGDGSSGRHAGLGVMTHEVFEKDMMACINELRSSASVENSIRFMRVEGN